MTRSRVVFTSLGLLLLLFMGAGIYLYHNLPVLTLALLQRFGVEDIQFDGLRHGDGEWSVDTLLLQGSYQNFDYNATLTSAELRYSWRSLLRGRIESLTLADLDLAIEQTASNTDARPFAFTLDMDEVSPAALLTLLPLHNLSVERWTLVFLSPGQVPLLAEGSLRIEEQLDLQLAAQLAGVGMTATLLASPSPPALDAQVALTGELAGELGGDSAAEPTGIANLSAQLRRGSGDAWVWEIQGQAHYAPLLAWLRESTIATGKTAAFLTADGLALAGESTLTARIQHPDELTFTNAPDSTPVLPPQLTANIRLVNAIRQLDVADSLDDLHGELIVEAEIADGRVESTLQPFALAGSLRTRRLSLPDSWQQWLHWKETTPVQLASTDPSSLAITSGGGWSLQASNAALTLGDVDNQFRIAELHLDATRSEEEAPQTAVQLGGILQTRLHKQGLPRLAIGLSQLASREQNAITLRLADTAENFQTLLEGTLDPATGAGTYALSLQTPNLAAFVASAAPPLRQLKLLTNDLVIDAGSISLDTAFKSKGFDATHWQQRSRLAVEGLSGSIDDIRFEGLTLTADWSGISQWVTHKPLQLTLAKLHTGFAISDVQARVSLPQATPIASPKLLLEDFSADLFGGQLSLTGAQPWDLAAEGNQLTLRAKGWQLAQLVALQKNRDIQAEGVLEGELPVTIEGGRVIIENGYLRALPPGGSIRYIANDASRALGVTSPELGMALDLLSDFQYHTLSSDVQLDKAGNLLLGLSIAGSNPERYDGQPINFNINLEQNIDPLLQSLRLSDTLVNRIEGGLQ